MLVAGCSSAGSTELLTPHGRNVSGSSQGFSTAGAKGCPCSSPSCCSLSRGDVPDPVSGVDAAGCQQLTRLIGRLPPCRGTGISC